MSELSQINVDGTTYELQDASARQLITQNANAIAELQESVSQNVVTKPTGHDISARCTSTTTSDVLMTFHFKPIKTQSQYYNHVLEPGFFENQGIKLWNNTEGKDIWRISPDYKSGDQIVISDNTCFSGFLSASTTQLIFLIPLTNKIDSINSISITGAMLIRQQGNYLLSEDYSHPISFSDSRFRSVVFTSSPCGIKVEIIANSNFGSNALNNTPVSVVPAGNWTINFN